MPKKLILNIVFSDQIKFKIAFDVSVNKLFCDVKNIAVQRLQQFSQIAPENIKEQIPENFEVVGFSLQDEKGFLFSEMDNVEDLCQDNEIVKLIYNKSLYVPKDPQSQPILISPNPIIKNSVQNVLSSQPNQPQQNTIQKSIDNNTNQIQSSPQPQQQTQQQQQNEFMNDEQIQQLKLQFYLDVSQYQKNQTIGGNFQFSLRFLQSENQEQEYQINCDLTDSLFQVSQQICKQLGLDDTQHSVAFYGLNGLPIVANLNQLYQKDIQETVSQLKSKVFNVIITKCNIGDKTFPKINSDLGSDQIFIIHQGPKVIKINVETETVLELKQRIFHKLNIPTNVQSLNYGGKILQDNLLLKDYNVQNNSNINLSFKMNQCIGYADSYNYNFFMPWMNHLIKQNDIGLRQFRTNSLVFYNKQATLQFIHIIRTYSNNNTCLTLAACSLMKILRLNQLSRIAFEEGMLRLFFDLIIDSKIIPQQFKIDQIFEYSRKWYAFLLKQSKEMNITEDIEKFETFRFMDLQCQITLQKINFPGFLKLNEQDTDTKKYIIVDLQSIEQKQQTEEKYQDKPFKDFTLINDPMLAEEFMIIKNFEKEELAWLPQKMIQMNKTVTNIPQNWHKNEDELKECKLYSSVELKQHPQAPVLTKNALKQVVIYTSMNKDVAKPVNLFDPMTGIEQPENPDQIAYQQIGGTVSNNTNNKKNNDSSDDEDSTIKVVSQITVEPEEAIVVLFDISGSMEEEFYKSEDLTRIGVVKAFFNAFADRTMAYNFKHVISLVYFDNRYIVKCEFTELFMQFKDLINKAKPQGMTALYVALKNATDSLLNFKKKYPNCILRIIALTDGEDNQGRYSPEFIAQNIVANNIILDSFVVYDQCDGLKQITKATGGQCFCPRTIQEGLRLFEFETIVSTKSRKQQQKLTQQQVSEYFKLKPKQIPFDIEPREYDLPIELTKNSVNPKQLVRQISSDTQSLDKIAPNQYLKRIMKELMNYEQKPHPFVKVFPCNHDISFWKVILIGPEQTPYSGGIYVLYMKFPSQYPLQPPELRFLTSIYHCNINSQGRICHSILGRNYTPDTRVLQIFESVYGLLMTPEPDDPLDTTIASEYMQENARYQKKALENTQQYAIKPIDEVIQQVLGAKGEDANLSDVEHQQKIEEINNWIDNLNKPQ